MYFLKTFLFVTIFSAIVNGECSLRNNTLSLSETCSEKNSDKSENEYFLLKSVIKYANDKNVNPKCLQNIELLQSAIESSEIWAIKALDASGNYQTALMSGNNYWLGSGVQCDYVNKPLKINYSRRFLRNMKEDLLVSTAPIEFEYRVVYVKHQSSYQFEMKIPLSESVLHIGLCLPKSCSDIEIANLVQNHFNEKSNDLEKTLQFEGKVLYAKNLKLDDSFYNKKTVTILKIFFSATFIMCILSYISSNYKEFDLMNSGLISKILNCFSVSDNFNAIWTIKEPPNSISIINGIRSISCILILWFHISWFMIFALSNRVILFSFMEKDSMGPISNSHLMVDAFFVISAFLSAQSYFNNEKLQEQVRRNGFWENLKLITRMLFNRYIRLSVMMFAVILFTEVSMSYVLRVTPFYSHDRYDEMCQRYWWRNILYIHNLFEWDDLCISWSWSTVCEMQFNAVFIIGFVLYTKRPNLMKRVFTGFAVLIAIISTFLCIHYKFRATIDVFFSSVSQLYIKPWSRVQPYICGTFAGWLISSTNSNSSKRLDTFRTNANILELVAISVVLISIYSNSTHSFSWQTISAILVPARFIFGSAIAILILLSFNEKKSYLNKFLSLGIFVHISKLSYAIYLISPVVILTFYGLKDQATNIEPLPFILEASGMTVIVYLVAFFTTLFVEMPYIKLFSLLTKKY